MKNFFFILMLFLIVLISVYLSWIGRNDTSWLILIGSAAMILLANLSKLKSIKIYGLEAELRETIHEANLTIDQLKSLAIVLAEPAISLIAASDASIPMPFLYRKNLVDRINFILKNNIEVSEDEIRRMNDVFRCRLRMRHGARIVANIQDIPLDLHLTFDGKFALPEHYEKLLADQNMLTNERRELIEDLKYFIEKDELRRPETWKNE